MAKNKALEEAGAYVPRSFDELGDVIKYVNYTNCSFACVPELTNIWPL